METARREIGRDGLPVGARAVERILARSRCERCGAPAHIMAAGSPRKFYCDAGCQLQSDAAAWEQRMGPAAALAAIRR